MNSLTEYEQRRAERIAQNRVYLKQLGLAASPQRKPQRLATKRPATEPAKRPRLEPTRRSQRLQQHASQDELHTAVAVDVDWDVVPRAAAERWRPLKQPDLAVIKALPAGSTHPDLDAHNVFRCRSMSDRALQTRIWKITNVAKLESFVRVLEELGKDALAQEAQEALTELTGGGGLGGSDGE